MRLAEPNENHQGETPRTEMACQAPPGALAALPYRRDGGSPSGLSAASVGTVRWRAITHTRERRGRTGAATVLWAPR